AEEAATSGLRSSTTSFRVTPPNASIVMLLKFEDRASDSPFIERVWRCDREHAGVFLSVAASHFEMVVTRLRDETFLTVRGPETKATMAECPAEGEWLGIRFALGVFMPESPPGNLRDRRDMALDGATGRSFWLSGSAWEYPDFENVEAFVSRLVRRGIIVRDYATDAVLRPQPSSISLRSAQRHFLHATGITRSTWHQIERARYATNLPRQGVSILDTVPEAGCFDQRHLTRSLKYLIGQTPAEIV